jgi:hypothetical protein
VSGKCQLWPRFRVRNSTVTKLLRKRSRWRKNSVLSPSRARKLARSRLPQPRPPNPPRNPCFFRLTIPGLRAEPSSPTAPAASRRPRAVPPWRGRGNKRTAPSLQSTFRFRSHSDHPPDSPSTSSEPNRLQIQPPTPLPTPDFRPVRSPSERTRPPPILPGSRHTPVTPRPALSLRRQEEVPGPTDVSTNTLLSPLPPRTSPRSRTPSPEDFAFTRWSPCT